MGDKPQGCPSCKSEIDISRLPPSFTLKKDLPKQEKKVGDVTKEFIEQSRSELKEQRKEMRKNNMVKEEKNV